MAIPVMLRRLLIVLVLTWAAAIRGAGIITFEGDSVTAGSYNNDGYKIHQQVLALSFCQSNGVAVTNIAKAGDRLEPASSFSIQDQLSNQYSNIFTVVGTPRYLFVMIGYNDWHQSTSSAYLTNGTFIQDLTNYWGRARTNGYVVLGSTIINDKDYDYLDQRAAYTNVNLQIKAVSNYCDILIDTDALYGGNPTGIHINDAEVAVLASAINDALWAYTGPPPPEPPVISGVAATPGTNDAVVVWTTSEATTNNAVDYGLTASYGSTVTVNTGGTGQSNYLSGLSADTLYHYRVRSTSAATGLSATNAGNTFTTLAIPAAASPGVQLRGLGTLRGGGELRGTQ